MGRQNHSALSSYSILYFRAFLVPGGWYVVVWLILTFSSRWYMKFHLLGVRSHVPSLLLRKQLIFENLMSPVLMNFNKNKSVDKFNFNLLKLFLLLKSSKTTRHSFKIFFSGQVLGMVPNSLYFSKEVPTNCCCPCQQLVSSTELEVEVGREYITFWSGRI